MRGLMPSRRLSLRNVADPPLEETDRVSSNVLAQGTRCVGAQGGKSRPFEFHFQDQTESAGLLRQRDA
jgi:hypothetical protein